MPLMSKEQVRAILPKVGDRLYLTPTFNRSLEYNTTAPRSCEVVYVNEAHLWYMVRFGRGFMESYKLPEGVLE